MDIREITKEEFLDLVASVPEFQGPEFFGVNGPMYASDDNAVLGVLMTGKSELYEGERFGYMVLGRVHDGYAPLAIDHDIAPADGPDAVRYRMQEVYSKGALSPVIAQDMAAEFFGDIVAEVKRQHPSLTDDEAVAFARGPT